MRRIVSDQLGARDERSGAVNAIVDTPAGSRSKFKYDEDRGLFFLNKLLPIGAAFPFDFGFIPGTRGEDGDALDILILGEEPTFTGCLVTVRLLGVIEAEQTEKHKTIRNDRLIGTPETAKIRPTERSLADVPRRVLTQIEHFFVAYNHAEGRVFTPLGRRGPRQAMKQIEEGVRLFRMQPRSGFRGPTTTATSPPRRRPRAGRSSPARRL